MNTPTLLRDADRARRLISGLNDEHSVRILRKYLEELDAQLSLARTLDTPQNQG